LTSTLEFYTHAIKTLSLKAVYEQIIERAKDAHFSLQNQSFLFVNFFLLVKVLFVESLKYKTKNYLPKQLQRVNGSELHFQHGS